MGFTIEDQYAVSSPQTENTRSTHASVASTTSET